MEELCYINLADILILEVNTKYLLLYSFNRFHYCKLLVEKSVKLW